MNGNREIGESNAENEAVNGQQAATISGDNTRGHHRLPLTLVVTEGTEAASDLHREFDKTLASLLNNVEMTSVADVARLAEELVTRRRALGWRGFRYLSVADLKRLQRALARADEQQARAVIERLRTYLDVQRALLLDRWETPADVRRLTIAVRQAYAQWSEVVSGPGTQWYTHWRGVVGGWWLNSLDGAAQVIGGLAMTTARLLRAVGRGQGRWTRVVRALAWLLEHFFSYEALRRTGFETSWGLRTYIPGTFGVAGNVGPWMMFYSGVLHDYQAKAVPARINPGITVSLPVWLATLNRWGFGAGPNLPFVNAYVDAARYKLLIGIDGVGYLRTGDWEGRGPYFTISASTPYRVGGEHYVERERVQSWI